MSITASGGLESAGDVDSAALPPSGRVVQVELDPELMAMLSQAASIGLEWNPPPYPECSWLDDWFLGAGHAAQHCPAPVPLFSELHEEVTKLWKLSLSPRIFTKVTQAALVEYLFACPCCQPLYCARCIYAVIPLG